MTMSTNNKEPTLSAHEFAEQIFQPIPRPPTERRGSNPMTDFGWAAALGVAALAIGAVLALAT